jgi:hypothetical protein
MRTRTFLSILIAVMLFLSVAGCNGSSDGSSDTSSSNDNSDSSDNNNDDDGNNDDTDWDTTDTTPASSYTNTIDFDANTA